MRWRSSGERRAADLHLDDIVAAIEIAAHFAAQRRQILAGIIIAAGGIDEHARVGGPAVALGEQAEQRLAGDLRHRVPHRHVDGADRDRALAMAARLFVRHHRRPDLVGIEIVAGRIEQRFRIGLDQTRRETLADQPALPVAAIRIEAVTDHPLAVAHDIGDDGDEARRHPGEIDIGVADGRGDRFCDLSDVDDADGHGGWLSIIFVMPGLVPGIHVFTLQQERRGWPGQGGAAATPSSDGYARP